MSTDTMTIDTTQIPRAALLRARCAEPDLHALLGSRDEDERARGVADLLRAGATPEQVGQALSLPYDDQHVVVAADTRADDHWAASADAAAAWLAGGKGRLTAWLLADMKSWAEVVDGASTTWEHAAHIVAVDDDGETIEVDAEAEYTAHPPAPECVPVGDPDGDERNDWAVDGVDGQGHEWCAPHRYVGGCEENPGVQALGGTAFEFNTICRLCGMARVEVHAGSQRDPGEAAETVEYYDSSPTFDDEFG